jgi:hypothetical protein
MTNGEISNAYSTGTITAQGGVGGVGGNGGNGGAGTSNTGGAGGAGATGGAGGPAFGGGVAGIIILGTVSGSYNTGNIIVDAGDGVTGGNGVKFGEVEHGGSKKS